MATILGNRRGKKTRHNTVTEAAGRVYQLLLAAGFVASPGVISPTGGGRSRITVTYETNRTRVVVVGAGVQDLHIYGAIDREKLETVLRSHIGKNLTIRNQP